MKQLSILSITFILSTLISCSKDATVASADTKNSPSIEDVYKSAGHSELTITDNNGYHVFDLQALEQGDYEVTTGTMTVGGRGVAANLHLSSRYLNQLCVEQTRSTLYSVEGINCNSDVASLQVTSAGQHRVALNYQLNGVSTLVYVTGAASSIALLAMEDYGSCPNAVSTNQRWIPLAMAIVALVATATCAVVNANDSNNCAGTASNCSNGVASYEYEGGNCGNGDCNVMCN